MVTLPSSPGQGGWIRPKSSLRTLVQTEAEISGHLTRAGGVPLRPRGTEMGEGVGGGTMAPAWLSGFRTRLVQPGPPHPLMTTALPVGRLCTGAKSGVGGKGGSWGGGGCGWPAGLCCRPVATARSAVPAKSARSMAGIVDCIRASCLLPRTPTSVHRRQSEKVG